MALEATEKFFKKKSKKFAGLKEALYLCTRFDKARSELSE